MNGRKYGDQFLLVLTIMIWGSLYVASRIVLPHMPALFLLFLRFSISSVLLLAVAKIRRVGHIHREDLGELLLIGIVGYFISNSALLLGIQYSSAAFSSLINALTPIGITFFAVLLLKEKVKGQDIVSLAVAVIGAMVIIGRPDGSVSALGIIFGLLSVILWSYATIHIKKLMAKYDSILVTGSGMGIAAVLALPASLAFMKLTGERVNFSGSLILPIAYICLICTAVSHLLWNRVLTKRAATQCASYYPIQPLTSMVLGILLLHEKLTMRFLIGAVLVMAGMLIHGVDLSRWHVREKI